MSKPDSYVHFGYGVTTEYDRIEIAPVKYEDEDTVVQCEENEADHWSVYIRDLEGMQHCIADVDTKEQAKDFVKLAYGLLRYSAELVIDNDA